MMGQPFECAACRKPLSGWKDTYYAVVHMRESPHKGLPLGQINLCDKCVEILIPLEED